MRQQKSHNLKQGYYFRNTCHFHNQLCALCGIIISREIDVLERQITQFSWDDADGSKRLPLMGRTKLALLKDKGGLNCPLDKVIADLKRFKLRFRVLYPKEDWGYELKQHVAYDLMAAIRQCNQQSNAPIRATSFLCDVNT